MKLEEEATCSVTGYTFLCYMLLPSGNQQGPLRNHRKSYSADYANLMLISPLDGPDDRYVIVIIIIIFLTGERERERERGWRSAEQRSVTSPPVKNSGEDGWMDTADAAEFGNAAIANGIRSNVLLCS